MISTIRDYYKYIHHDAQVKIDWNMIEIFSFQNHRKNDKNERINIKALDGNTSK